MAATTVRIINSLPAVADHPQFQAMACPRSPSTTLATASQLAVSTMMWLETRSAPWLLAADTSDLDMTLPIEWCRYWLTTIRLFLRVTRMVVRMRDWFLMKVDIEPTLTVKA